MAKSYIFRLLLFVLLISAVAKPVGGYPQSLKYSDNLKEGQVFEWFSTNLLVDKGGNTTFSDSYNFTVVVVESPAGVEHFDYLFKASDYFTLYINNSITTNENLFHWESPPLIFPVVENQTANHFVADAGQSSVDNATFDDILYTKITQYTTTKGSFYRTMEYYFETGILKKLYSSEMDADGNIIYEYHIDLIRPSYQDEVSLIDESNESLQASASDQFILSSPSLMIFLGWIAFMKSSRYSSGKCKNI